MFQQEENERREGAAYMSGASEYCDPNKQLVLDKISSKQITGIDYSNLKENTDWHSVTLGKEYFFFGSKPSDESVYEEHAPKDMKKIIEHVNVKTSLDKKGLLEFSCSFPTSNHIFRAENWSVDPNVKQKIIAEQRITKALHNVFLLRAEKEKEFPSAFLEARKMNIFKLFEFERIAAENPSMFVRNDFEPNSNEFKCEPKSNFIPALVQLKVVEPEVEKEYVIKIYLKDDNVKQASEQIIELIEQCFKRKDEKRAKTIKVKISLALCPLEIYENEKIYRSDTGTRETKEPIRLIKLV